MKILFDHQIFCLQRYGGISRYFSEIAAYMAAITEHDHDVEIFSPFYLNEYLPIHNNKISQRGVKIPPLYGVGRLAAWVIDTALAHMVLRSRCNVDIFHETYYSGVDYCPRSARRIITIHDLIYEKFHDQFPRQDKMRQIRANAVEMADHVICVSENTRKDLIEYLGVSEYKISVVYHGCSLSEDFGKACAVAKPHILYVGQRGGYKNFENLLRAYANSSLLRGELLLVCFGGGVFSVAEKNMMRTLGLSPNDVVQISGDDSVLRGLYASAEAFVYPSLYEGFGIPLLEAMSLDCPVVCSNASSFPEVVGGAAELFDPEDQGAIQHAIEKVVFSSDVKASLVKLGRERVKQFSWGKCARDTLQVYGQQL